MIDYNLLRSEYAKCFLDRSRVYMIEHYLSTFDATQKKQVNFELFPRQKDLCATLGNANNVVTTKPRQAGITTTAGAFIACEMALADTKSPQTVLVIGNTIDLAQQMLTKIRDFLMQFPVWIWGDLLDEYELEPTEIPTKKQIFKVCNSKELVLKNECRVVARSSGPDASRGVGGVTWLIFDEAAFIENGNDVYASALPTVSTGGHVIMISTPNGKDLLYYETCRQAKLKGTKDWNNFELVELKWYQDPRYNKYLEWTRKNEEGEIEIQKENYVDDKGSVRYDTDRWAKMVENGWKPRSTWYQKMCKQFNNDSKKIAQELDVSFLGSASNVIEPEFIEMQTNLNKRDPLYTDPIEEDTWIWKKPIPGHTYICSCLPSGQIVMTNSGYKNIEQVTPNDKLLDLNGKYVNIKECKRRNANEKIYSFKISNFCKNIDFTGEHPLYVSSPIKKRWYSKTDNSIYEFNERYLEHNFNYVNASEVNEGQWVCQPNVYYDNILPEDDIVSYLKKYDLDTYYNSDIFWWYCGIWAAEGCSWNNNINTTHNINENIIVNKVISFINLLNKKAPYVKINNNEHTINICFSNNGLKKFLIDNIGCGAKNKKLSELIKKLPYCYRRDFLNGYLDGDGSIYESKRDGLIMSFGSVSLNLLVDVQDILFSFGVVSCLSVSHNERVDEICGRFVNSNILYELKIPNSELNLLINGKRDKRRTTANCYLSKDKKYIYSKIKKITEYDYSGFVYNFETDTHSFCTYRCVTHNCDPSRGDAADRTAIEIIDLNGQEEDGTPCVEQVLEYHGKKTSDVVGEMIYQYASMYNNAFAIVDAVGGVGDAALLTLMRLGYKNLYYDDPLLKTYTIQREASSIGVTSEGKLPGFHSSSVRYQMLTNFADMVKTNQIKIRSKRVIAEMDTWIYKGPAARIDHQDGAHDDTLTCLAMGLFVVKYSMARQEKTKALDAAILKGWTCGNVVEYVKKNDTEEYAGSKKKKAPFFCATSTSNKKFGAYKWLLR